MSAEAGGTGVSSDQPIDVFISYAHVDEGYVDELRKHLRVFQRLGLIRGWHDRQIVPGQKWSGEIDRNLEEADIILLLISDDFIASDYCYEIEGKRALERSKSGDAVTIPIIVRPARGDLTVFRGLQALPTDGKAVTEWNNEDVAWTNIASGVRRAIDARRERLSAAEPEEQGVKVPAPPSPPPTGPAAERVSTEPDLPPPPSPPTKPAGEGIQDESAPPPPSLPDNCEELRSQAEEILRGRSITPGKALALAKGLKRCNFFGHARRVLKLTSGEWIEDRKLALEVRQQHALCTYKDAGLPVHSRLETALEILNEAGDLDSTINQETLGIAGAIHKRKWELDRRRVHLVRSLDYYLRGYAQGAGNDDGYTAINAAYVLDVQAAEAERSVPGRSNAGELRKQADEIRENLAGILPELPKRPDKAYLKDAWWFFATIGEALFGLGRYDEALHWLVDRAATLEVSSWEYEATARQLAAVARCRLPPGHIPFRDLEASDAGRALKKFLEACHAPGALTTSLGKIGLALSGGGFRASLFHIGVLARLAELDVLRHVEVLSCVSGGSILGAHYYLEVRNLLQKKPDGEITREDYLEIVDRIARDFLSGVQKNIRTRVILNPLKTAKMLFTSGYSRTHRLGELFEEHLYARVEDGVGPERWLNDLFVRPKGEGRFFNPQTDNWRRRAKAPILVLNATTLNTGHNWQFTASWMGEPSNAMEPDVDSNERLRRMYYREAPPQYRKFRLGYAVAASACVPGLFEPLSLRGLYPDRTVRLVDGGVHDNQGIVGLLEQDCTVHLVSDASGQMGTEPEPSTGPLGVPLRTTSVLQARVRDAEYRELSTRREASVLRGFMFVHLKKGISSEPIDWIDCSDPHEASEQAAPASKRGVLTGYGVLKGMQRALSDIRTDLDSFSDAEAFALMYSGYQMTADGFPRANPDFPVADVAPYDPDAAPYDWQFLRIAPAMKDPDKYAPLLRIVEVGKSRAFKAWKLIPMLRYASWVLAAGGLALAAWLAWLWWDKTLLTVANVAIVVIGLIVSAVLGKIVWRVVRFRDTLMKVGLYGVLAVVGWAGAGIHLSLFDRLFLKTGRLEEVLSNDEDGQ